MIKKSHTGMIINPSKIKQVKYILFLFMIAFSIQITKAQDSTEVGLRRNTIKYDLTSNLLYRNSINFSYERIVKQNQSFVLTAGVQEFPTIINFGENVQGKREVDRSGYKFGGEYRFYLKKENKYATPRGVYIGPYYTALGFKSEQDIIYNGGEEPEEANLDARLNIHSIGAQLGYQFVFNDRWTLDLVLIGPSISSYKFNLKLDGDFQFDPDNVSNEILDELLNRIPLLEEFLNEKELNRNGILNTWALGYKYQFLVGYRFGKYKALKKK